MCSPQPYASRANAVSSAIICHRAGSQRVSIGASMFTPSRAPEISRRTAPCTARLEPRDAVYDASVIVHHKDSAHHSLAVIGKRAVSRGNFQVGIAGKRKWTAAKRLAERIVRIEGVRAYGYDFGVQFADGVVLALQRTQHLRAAGRLVLHVESENNTPVNNDRAQSNAPRRAWQREVGRNIACIYHSLQSYCIAARSELKPSKLAVSLPEDADRLSQARFMESYYGKKSISQMKLTLSFRAKREILSRKQVCM